MEIINKTDEVINLEGTVAGVVYKIDGDIICFVDEYNTTYRMNKNILKVRHKMDKYKKYLFIEKRKHLFK